MLKPKPMKKLVVFGPKSYMKEVIEKLYELDVVHINDHSKKGDTVFEIGTPLEENEELSELLVKTRSIKNTLGIEGKGAIKSKMIPDIRKKITKIYSDVHTAFEKKKYYTKIMELIQHNKLSHISKYIKIFDREEFDGMAHYIGFVRNPSDVSEKLKEISTKITIKKGMYENLNMFAVFGPTKLKAKTLEVLKGADFAGIPQPFIASNYSSLRSENFKNFKSTSDEVDALQKHVDDADETIDKAKKNEASFIKDAEATLKSEVDKAEAPLRLGTTDNTFLLNGWVPKKNAAKVETGINKISKSIQVEIEEPGRHDKVPISFDNPKIVRPFESFMELYTLPSYKEIDPTFFMFLTFPIFFGFMLGDVGYGLITLLIFWLVKKKMPGMKNMMNAFIIASIATIIFGMVFGEYFGMEFVPHSIAEKIGMQPMRDLHTGEIMYPIPHLFARSHHISDLMSISVVMGIVHILIGLIVGFINIFKDHGFKHAMLEKGGWMMIMPLIIWLLQSYLGVITGPIGLMIGALLPGLPVLAGLFGVGAVLTIWGEGITGLIEVMFFSLMSNILSYARLMAVGLASLSLAAVVNDMAGNMIQQGIGGIIAAIIVLVLGHTINIALGILSPFLHSLRLHYVEFFGKFYKGGGSRFVSFGPDSK